MKLIRCLILPAAAMLAATTLSAADPLAIAGQGFFASGGTVTAPRPGDYDVSRCWKEIGLNENARFRSPRCFRGCTGKHA